MHEYLSGERERKWEWMYTCVQEYDNKMFLRYMHKKRRSWSNGSEVEESAFTRWVKKEKVDKVFKESKERNKLIHLEKNSYTSLKKVEWWHEELIYEEKIVVELKRNKKRWEISRRKNVGKLFLWWS